MPENTLEWLRRAEWPEGGIAAWQEPDGQWHTSYPEVTGYLIPTLFDWEEVELAIRCADWLLPIQQKSGAFTCMDGFERSFDTAACMEGLNRAFAETGQGKYGLAAARAREWLLTQIRPDGAMRITPEGEKTHVYTMRASALVGSDAGLDYWRSDEAWNPRWDVKQRPHYIAYALDGMWEMGLRHSSVRHALEASQRVILPSGLFPYWCRTGWEPDSGTCTTATAQMAILYRRVGLDAGPLIEAVEKTLTPDGGVRRGLEDDRCVSWAAKFYLDAVHEA